MTGALDIENWIFPKVIIYENVLKVGRFFTAQKTLPYLRYAFCKNLFTCCVHDKVKIHHILFNYLTYKHILVLAIDSIYRRTDLFQKWQQSRHL